MDSSRKGGFPIRLWRDLLAGSLCTAGLLHGGFALAQETAHAVLNPYAGGAKAPARVTPEAAASPVAAHGGLRPATIRPVAKGALVNPHVAGLLPLPDRKASSQPELATEESPRTAPMSPAVETTQHGGDSPTIFNPTISKRPAPLMIQNDAVQPRRLSPPTAEEQLAPIVTPAAAKRRLFPPPVTTEEKPLPQARPIGTTLPAASRAAAAAAEEAAEHEQRSIVVDAPRTLESAVPAEDVTAPADSSAGPADELQPLPPIVSASQHREGRRALQSTPAEPENKPAETQARVQQFEDRRLSRAILAQNEAQPAQPERQPAAAPAELPEGSPFEQIRESGSLAVQVRRSLLLRTQKDIFRTAVVDDSICEIVQFTPRELSIIGRSQGSTHVTFWFDDPNMLPVTYEVEVLPDSKQVKIEEEQYRMLEDVLNEMFPDSKIQLTLAANKLIVRGQAKDSEEAFQIMTIIRGQAQNRAGWNNAWNAGINEGQAAQPLADTATGASRRAQYQIVNMLRVPGVQQVALRVKIAELNRTAARNFGLDIKGTIDLDGTSNILLNSLSAVTTGEAPPILFNVDGDDISIGLNALQQHGVVKLLSEPTLVTMSGRPATFLAGGEFAVPTVVGSAGLNAVTTDFRAFGAIISFLPTVVDKDRIRLEVAPEFSEINSNLSTGGASTGSIPSLNVRAATTTVEMREGQTLAIAGLLQDSMTANNAGDLPFLQKIIGRRSVTRNENELIILVTPELVHPMEPEEVPPLPGFDVTEPTNAQFYLHGDLEGNPTMDYRSTVWPRLKKRYKAGGPAMTSGPFGHGQ